MIRIVTCRVLLAVAFAVAGCAGGTPENRESVEQVTAYQAQYRSDLDQTIDDRNDRSVALNLERCAAPAATRQNPVFRPQVDLLSRSDLLDVAIGDDKTLSGSAEVGQDGTLRLPHLSAVRAHGRTIDAVEDAIRTQLVREGFYRVAPRVSVRLADKAAAKVHVAGAVFDPGSVTVGGIRGDTVDKARQDAIGASGEGRTLSRALASAGGIRPDADLANVTVLRGGQRIIVDARPAVSGRRFDDMVLIADDQIDVPSRGCFQEALMAPMALTAPGVKVFLSNLTKPADANALSAIGKEARELRYGTRLIQAVVGMNCVGGTAATNAARSVVLFSRNPLTKESIVIERRIEDLLRRSDRDELDPYILPGDAIACYDSTVTNIVDVARSISLVIGTSLPFLVL
ncbi:MAG: polysaccharide biosynthesis/export family protein [Pseudomonadota bacterium]